jgi:MinD superfamily P-loop ATPase
MKELVIISGKGGTGKTSLMAAFSALAKAKVICDADVDAADLHLVAAPVHRTANDFQSGHSPVIDPEKCTECGLCRDLCRWDAIRPDFSLDKLACEGCGVCFYFCPEKAIDFVPNTCGQWFISDSRFGPMVHARLGIAEENSGRLVSLVRQEAKKVAETEGAGLILTDGPPGIGCPVIAAIGGANAVLIVTEPTVSGQHDMDRVLQLASHFKVPAMLCINKYDLNPPLAEKMANEAETDGVGFLGRIPFDPIFTRAMVNGRSIVEEDETAEATLAVKQIWKKVCLRMEGMD